MSVLYAAFSTSVSLPHSFLKLLENTRPTLTRFLPRDFNNYNSYYIYTSKGSGAIFAVHPVIWNNVLHAD